MALALLWMTVMACFVSLCLGLYGLFFPRGALRLVGLALDPTRPEGVSEIRSTYGGVFTGMSLIALYTLVAFDNPFMAICVGTAWLFAGLARVASTLVDRVPFRANVPGILVELGLATFLIMPPLMVYRPDAGGL